MAGPEQPKSLRLAFGLWVAVGIPLVVVLVGVVILFAAANLRAGYRGARIWLTAFGIAAAVQFVVAITGGFGFQLLWLLPDTAALAATIAMWQRDTTEYLRQLREISGGQSVP